jgi:chromosome segregation ATPase
MSSNFEFKYNPYKESDNVYSSLTPQDVYGRFSSTAGDCASFFDMRQDETCFAFDERTDGPKPSRSSNSIVQQVMNYGRPPAVSRSLATLDDERGLCDSISKLPNVAMSRANGSVQAPQDDLKAALEADNSELRKRLELSTETIVATRDENNLLRGRLQASAATIEELDRRLRDTNAATGAGQADLQRLAEELANVKRQLVKATSDFNAEFGKTQEQAQEIERVKKLLGTQRTQIGQQNKEIRDKTEAIEELESTNKSLLDRIRKLTTATPPAAAGGDDEEDELFEDGSEHEA